MLAFPSIRVHRNAANLPLARALTLFIAAVCIALALMTAMLGWNARREWLRNAGDATINLAFSLAQHAEATVKQSDTVLHEVADKLQGRDFSPERLQRLSAIMGARVAQQPQLHGLFVYDAGGRWIAHTRAPPHPDVSNADREYFIYHQTHADPGLHIGLPVRSKSTGEWILPLSRRLEHANGSFAGVALATVRLAYFDAFYEKFDVGRRGLFVLALRSGALLTRRPFKPEMVGASVANTYVFREFRMHDLSRTVIHVSPYDGIERQYAARDVDTYPLTVLAAVPTDEILAGWRARMTLQVSALTGMIALLICGGSFLVRQLKLQAVARKQLNESYAKVQNLEQALDKHAILDISDTRHRIIHANDRYCRISGYSSEELLGRDATFMSADCQTAEYLAGIRSTIEAGQVWKGETCSRSKSGATFWLNTTIVPFLDELGNIYQYVAIRNDITAQKDAERKLLHAKTVLEESNRELSALSRLDGLTGLANRREFDAVLDAAYDPALRSRHALALLMIDVDFFKAYNDRYGHPAGDECLRQIARVLLRQLMRAGDVAARYGGEEFAVLLPDTDLDGAAAVADRIRADLAELALPHAGHPQGMVTVSIGYHVAAPESAMLPALELVAGADRALYSAKSTGRNRALSWLQVQAAGVGQSAPAAIVSPT